MYPFLSAFFDSVYFLITDFKNGVLMRKYKLSGIIKQGKYCKSRMLSASLHSFLPHSFIHQRLIGLSPGLGPGIIMVRETDMIPVPVSMNFSLLFSLMHSPA